MCSSPGGGSTTWCTSQVRGCASSHKPFTCITSFQQNNVHILPNYTPPPTIPPNACRGSLTHGMVVFSPLRAACLAVPEAQTSSWEVPVTRLS